MKKKPSYPLPIPLWARPSKMIFQGQDGTVRFAVFLSYLTVSLSFCSLVLFGSSCCLSAKISVPLSVSLCISRGVAGFWRWKNGGRKAICGDKSSQWCFSIELGLLCYVLPPRRCLMRYPAGLWVVAKIGLIDFPTLHNAGLFILLWYHLPPADGSVEL